MLRHFWATLGFYPKEIVISIRAVFLFGFQFVCLLACADDDVIEEEVPIEVSFLQEDEHLILASARLADGVVIENVRVRKDARLDDWVLELREIAKLQVSSSVDVLAEQKFQVDDDTYSHLVYAVLRSLKVEYPNLVVRRLQIDLDLVDSTWRAVMETVKRESSEMAGSIEQMNRRISTAIVETLSSSEQLRVTCDALEAYGASCNERPVSMNPVAFRPEVIGEPWSSLAEQSDAALQQSAWFTIRTQ